jgi:pyruvate,orthophosphate dikinase
MADLYPILIGLAPTCGGAAEAGNKAWNLMLLAQAGLSVPPAFVLPTDWCHRLGQSDAVPLSTVLSQGIAGLETATTLRFGASRRPLLVSVRSGAAVSMPGMMDTVLDVGLNATTVEALVRLHGNPRLAWDCYRRLIQGYAEIVAELPTAPFDALVAQELSRAEVELERELDYRSLRALTHAMLDCYLALKGSRFPVDPHEQLAAATKAVFRSWNSPKAISYRRLNNISDAPGTAVTIQTMVYGNAGSGSGSGVGFTRNPDTGAPGMYFDFQFNGQGEDVVGGRRRLEDERRLQNELPEIWAQLNNVCHKLEELFHDVQDFEFTVQSGRLFLLQTRRAKRTDWAALKIATDMVDAGVLKPAEALARLAGIHLKGIGRTRFAAPLPAPLTNAQAAGMGVASGPIALDSAAAKRLAALGTPPVFVRDDIVTADIEGIAVSSAILTGSGGRTSHAAVIARQLGKVCLVSCRGLQINLISRQCMIGTQTFGEGDFLSIDGNTGDIYAGKVAVITEHPVAALAAVASWTDAAARHASPAPRTSVG